MEPTELSGSTGPVISRRSILRVSALGFAGVALGAANPGARAFGAVATSLTDDAGTALQLTMRPCLVEMVDRTRVPMWAFDSPTTGIRFPGPVIFAREGQPVVVDVTNLLDRDHAWAIPGVVSADPIAPGQTRRIFFTAPAAGTYIYLDPSQAPMHRAMGLAGVFVVLPADDTATTPYTAPTTQIRNLFDDLGTAAHFPGDPWRAARSWLWVFASVDPAMNARIFDDPDLSEERFHDEYLPTYLTLNGRSGYFSAHDPSTMLTGRVGQPALIRVANVGLADHSPHMHGNHIYLLANDGELKTNVIAMDTWEVSPLGTADVLHPFIRPPDAYPWPPSDPAVWTTDFAGTGMPGMVYPMHCHTELGLRANGGNYPHGLITHWVLTGDLDAPAQPDPTEPELPADPEPPAAPPPPSEPVPPEPEPEPARPPASGGPTKPSTPGVPTGPAAPRPTVPRWSRRNWPRGTAARARAQAAAEARADARARAAARLARTRRRWGHITKEGRP